MLITSKIITNLIALQFLRVIAMDHVLETHKTALAKYVLAVNASPLLKKFQTIRELELNQSIHLDVYHQIKLVDFYR